MIIRNVGNFERQKLINLQFQIVTIQCKCLPGTVGFSSIKCTCKYFIAIQVLYVRIRKYVVESQHYRVLFFIQRVKLTITYTTLTKLYKLQSVYFFLVQGYFVFLTQLFAENPFQKYYLLINESCLFSKSCRIQSPEGSKKKKREKKEKNFSKSWCKTFHLFGKNNLISSG